ncbi:MAG: TraR/DksA C4-type zinc finger protein [Planctomycetes bacterium]|nr:TraR/DksA C4-type zinc finger protein [Planctomycetota bacterium]
MAEKRKKTSKTEVQEQTPKTHLNSADLQHFRELLLQKRKQILGNVSEIEGEALRKSRLDASGDLSSMPIHMADLGTDNFEQEFSLELMDSERRLLVEIDEALNRITAGTYGICEGTGKPISKARLEAQPWARYSVEYAKMVEQGQAKEGQ